MDQSEDFSESSLNLDLLELVCYVCLDVLTDIALFVLPPSRQTASAAETATTAPQRRERRGILTGISSSLLSPSASMSQPITAHTETAGDPGDL